MNYEMLEEAGRLEFHLLSPIIDVHMLGVIQLSIDEIVNKVAAYLLYRGNLYDPGFVRSWPRNRIRRNVSSPYDNFVQTRIEFISQGSIYEALSFAIPAVLADSNVRAILQNLAANVVWAIGVSGVRGITARQATPPDPELADVAPGLDPIDIGPNVRDVIRAVAETGRKSTIRLTYDLPDRGKGSVVIQIDGA